MQAKADDVVWKQNFGCLGNGLGYAIGASIADGGKRPVLLTTSDSSFLYHISDLEVAHRFNLPLVVVVAVDNSWGLEVGVYKRTFGHGRSEEHTSELQSLMRISYAVFCLKKKNKKTHTTNNHRTQQI